MVYANCNRTVRPVRTRVATWAGFPAPALGNQCRRGAEAIAAATGSSYKVTAADAGQALSCRVTGSNAAGSATAASAAVTVSALTPRLALTARPRVKGAGVTLRLACRGATRCAGQVLLTTTERLRVNKVVRPSSRSRRKLMTLTRRETDQRFVPVDARSAP
jgi:hypothetical protein